MIARRPASTKFCWPSPLVTLGILLAASVQPACSQPTPASAAAAADSPSLDSQSPDSQSPGSDATGADTASCGIYVPPSIKASCHSCSFSKASSCAANGCYGGWYCNAGSQACVPPPKGCSSHGADVGHWPKRGAPLACQDYGKYGDTNSTGHCGHWRWSVKTGVDSLAPKVDFHPEVTTIAHLVSLPSPLPASETAGYGSPRHAPYEEKVFELKNVHVYEIGLSADGDYHLALDDGQGHTMIAEVPYPGCIGSSSSFGCLVTHARSVVDAKVGKLKGFRKVDMTATLIGVGFFDFIHHQDGVASNGMELHPILAVYFGKGPG